MQDFGAGPARARRQNGAQTILDSSDEEAEEAEGSDAQQENAGDTHNRDGGAAPEAQEDEEEDTGPPPDRFGLEHRCPMFCCHHALAHQENNARLGLGLGKAEHTVLEVQLVFVAR